MKAEDIDYIKAAEDKILMCIDSCTTIHHVVGTWNLIDNYIRWLKYKDIEHEKNITLFTIQRLLVEKSIEIKANN